MKISSSKPTGKIYKCRGAHQVWIKDSGWKITNLCESGDNIITGEKAIRIETTTASSSYVPITIFLCKSCAQRVLSELSKAVAEIS
jgi:hypothetical protein